ncbi:MAG: hypothetical protein M1834_002121 [Cirrosporium novae-zelandiae]|nr:MAG: hypothetical protein M1834_002121 [Cirrosporium novae-zelandiae]
MELKREYEMVLLGATGFTGQLCVEYVTVHFPTNFRWAVAGRSESKLSSIVADAKKLNPDRLQPDVLVVPLEKEELNDLATKSIVIINCVGPYHIYSTPVVEACAENGTHYLDFTGETVWVEEMIRKYDETARKSGAMIITSVAVESAPSDLLAYTLYKHVSPASPKTIEACIHTLAPRPSGGTIATMLTTNRDYSNEELIPSNPPLPEHKMHKNPHLGYLYPSMMSMPNVHTVTRSVNLIPSVYPPNLVYKEYARASNPISQVLTYVSMTVGMIILGLLPPLRTLLLKVIPSPGTGPQGVEKDVLETRAVAYNSDGKAVGFGKFYWKGGLYPLTAMLGCEAAMTILRGKSEPVSKIRSGFLTPASLGDEFVEKVGIAGGALDIKKERMW